MTRDLDLELLLDSPDTSDYTFDTLETPAHPSTIQDSTNLLDDTSMQCEVSPLLDASPSFQSAQGNGIRMALESRYYQAKNTGNVEEFVKIVSMIGDEHETWMEIIKCKCLKFIFEHHVMNKQYREAIICIKSILMANIPRVQMQRIIKAVLDVVEREGGESSSANWYVFVEVFTECLLSSLDRTRDSDLWTSTGLMQLNVLVVQKKRYALKFGPILEAALMESVEDFITERNKKLLKMFHLMVQAYNDASDLPHLIACAERAKHLKGINDVLFNEIMIQSGLAHLKLRSFSTAEAILGRVAPELTPFCNPKLYNNDILAFLDSTELPARNDINSFLWDRIEILEQIELTRTTLTSLSESRREVSFDELPVQDEHIIARSIMYNPLAKVARMDQSNRKVVFCAYFGA